LRIAYHQERTTAIVYNPTKASATKFPGVLAVSAVLDFQVAFIKFIKLTVCKIIRISVITFIICVICEILWIGAGQVFILKFFTSIEPLKSILPEGPFAW
jgi:hypothetical protein